MRRRSQSPDSKLTKVSECLDSPGTSLAVLQQRAEKLARLQLALWPALPAPLQAHCRLANVRQGSLILTADSPLWAAQARHQTKALLNRARQLKVTLDRIEVRVLPVTLSRQQPPVRRTLSEVARSHLTRAADASSDPELEAILRRIADH